MNIFNALGFQPHGYLPIRPLPEGGWFVRNYEFVSTHFIAYPDKNPDSYEGVVPADSMKVISYGKSNARINKMIYQSLSRIEDCVPLKGVFSGIFSPRTNSGVIPDNQEAFRAALGIPEDRYTLVISKVGGHFEKFDLPYQKTACCMPSCDGMTVLVAQQDYFTVFDNPLD